MSTDYIKNIGPGGEPDGKIVAINPGGHLVATNLIPLKGGGIGLKPGWRPATAADVEAAKAVEAKRKAAELAAAKKGG